jgi:Tfp pilus assembly protein PilO
MQISKLITHPRTSIAVCVFALILTVCFQQFWVQPKSGELNDIETKISTLQKKMEADQLAYNDLQKRTPASVESASASQLLDQYLKFNGHFSSVVNGIVSNSQGGSFSLTKISSESQVQTVGYTQTLYTVEAEAPFIAIGKFLEKMEDSPLLTEVDSIDISRIGTEMRRCKAKIKLFSYVGAE